MQQSQFKYLESSGVRCAYLGSIASNKALLFIGRSNTQKNSIPLQELLHRLILDGYLLLWPESRNHLISKLLTEKSVRAVGWIDRIFGPNESLLKQYLRRVSKGLILILYPSKWDYFLSFFIRDEIANQVLLNRQVIQMLGKNKSITILSHSAGGVIASRLRNESNLKNIICFGYPFKHPDKEEEPYRTKDLNSIQNRFLIIQGDKDEYGGLGVENRYELSPHIEFEFVESTHEYENLSIDEWIRVTKRIESFLDA